MFSDKTLSISEKLASQMGSDDHLHLKDQSVEAKEEPIFVPLD